MKVPSALVGCTILCESFFAASLAASTFTIGPNGIDSAGLTLANGMPMNGGGTGLTPAVIIGQVELERPGKSIDDGGFDDAAHSSRDVVPNLLFVRTTSDSTIANVLTSDHGEAVASIMIGKDMTVPNPNDPGNPVYPPTGVALGATLNAAAINFGTTPANWQTEAAVTTNNLVEASISARALNMSFGMTLPAGGTYDGNQHLTQFIDWSASQELFLLYVVAGNQGNSIPIPKDNFNGLTVGRSAIDGGVYRRVSPGNTFTEDAVGDRTSIGLLAPGDDIDLTGLNFVFRPNAPGVGGNGGTSYATPHVTATVALLQQYANERLNAGAAGWGLGARHHEVMKAVLMNSADKLIDNGVGTIVPGQSSPVPQGSLLGMARTVLMQPISGGNQSPTWFDSQAWDDSPEGPGHAYPLDVQMGAGHLNARRARTQFAAGEHEADSSDIPTIGWDFGTMSGAGSENHYPFAGELLADSFISITLAWDRLVNFATDLAPFGEYNAGDTFQTYTDNGVNPPDDFVTSDLDIYLVEKGDLYTQAVALSDSAVGTVEHLFFQIPQTGEYEFIIRQHDEEGGVNQNYGVAWWARSALPANPPGDYNGDQIVDVQDYATWRGDFGDSVSAGTGADGNNDGTVNAADYVIWRKQVNAGSGSGFAAVPEPSAIAASLVLSLTFAAIRRSKRARYSNTGPAQKTLLTGLKIVAPFFAWSCYSHGTLRHHRRYLVSI